MTFNASQVRAIILAASGNRPPHLTVAEAQAVVAVAWLAVDADHREDPDEIASLNAIEAEILQLAGAGEEPAADVPMDDEELADRLAELAPKLTSELARELAYGVAYALSVVDFQLAVAEGSLLTKLGQALAIPDDRARDIAEAVGSAVTPSK
jgi:hypothetical protein